ncbi:MAG TPA: hypothetical protein VLL75_18400 [Vicinamibacteria bacterium]|nr:hypothetical protein [Vicinamibacteria bacterium]
MRGSLLRAAAALLMAVIVADLVGDTACDSFVFDVGTVTVASGSTAPGEPCAGVCVADCFCCSRSTAADSAVAAPELPRLTAMDAPAAEAPSAGVNPVVDHPPPLQA